ncbi:unnamed protein product [Rotaria magnacalcarata]|uniref:Replication protein A subunit n=1 Tax=Rotaria magnacalcarata TaxID=392030 RepID=A0A816ZZU3_9BILA|nr:unnamed protein product [Rotaria magnacalcarata]
MTSQRLTTGALLRYIRGNTTEKANLQVVGIKPIESKTDDPSGSAKRYRLMLSDGKSTFSSCMLGTQMNKLIETNTLKENSIIRIDRVMVNSIDKQNGRVMLMLYEIEVIESDFERIGDPVALPLTDIINSGPNANRLEAATNNPPAASAAAPTTNVIRQGAKALPTLDDRKKPNGDNRAAAKGANVIDKERIINIDTLNPYMNKWTIKARIRKLFNCDLVDKSGEIRATGFNAECDRLYSMLEIGEVYYITKASLKAANRQYNTTNSDYEMTFNHDTIIEACDVGEGENIPQVQYNFISISEIANRAANSVCDVIGVVKSTSDMQTIVSKASQKEFSKRDILLVDEKASISTTLWGQQAEEFDGSSHPVIAFKGIKIGDFNGRTLSVTNSTLTRQDPTETERTVELRVWFDNEGKLMDLPDLSKAGEAGNRPTVMKTLSQVIADGIGLGDKPDYVSVKAVVTLIKKDSAVYMMCPEGKCGKKIVDENNGTYRCEKCNKTYNSFKWAYMISAEISDTTGAQWVTIFRNEAETLLGVSAEEFGNHKLNQAESIVDEIISKAINHELIFKLRAKAEQYNDERKIRFTCVSITEIDWPAHGRRLLNEINQMEPVQN